MPNRCNHEMGLAAGIVGVWAVGVVDVGGVGGVWVVLGW